jgi:opacity protein-like surface antigen
MGGKSDFPAHFFMFECISLQPGARAMTGTPNTISFTHNSLRTLALATAALCCSLAANAAPVDAPPPHAPAAKNNSAFSFGPYKHLNTALEAPSLAASTRVKGSPLGLAAGASDALMPNATGVTLAFASGECGQERWAQLDAAQVAAANVPSLHAAGLRYTISTGGEGNVFTCSSDAGMEAFVARYESPSLVGFDFDIEAGQTPEMIGALLQRIKTAQQRRPHLRMSFTVATFAASDGSQTSLNTQGQQVLAAIRAVGLERYFINLMVMDFGAASPAVCVVRNGRCDMAASAQQAAGNLHQKLGVPLAQIELTPMIGINDVVDNIFMPADAIQLANFVKTEKLGGLHFWSLDRDTPCPDGKAQVSPTCNGIQDHTPLAFARAFAWGLR